MCNRLLLPNKLLKADYLRYFNEKASRNRWDRSSGQCPILIIVKIRAILSYHHRYVSSYNSLNYI